MPRDDRLPLREDEINWDLVGLHLDEAEFLVAQWRWVRTSPQFTLDEVRKGPEARLGAHVDALVLNGPRAIERLVLPALETEPPRVAAAGLVLINAGDPQIFEELDALYMPQADVEPPAWRDGGLRLALALGEHPQLEDWLDTDGAELDEVSLAALARAHADRGRTPGSWLDLALDHDDDAVRSAALCAARFSDPLHYRAAVEAHLHHGHEQVGLAALTTALWWNSSAALERLVGRVRRGSEHAPRLVMEWLACRGGPQAVELLAPFLMTPARRRDALWALGLSGFPAAVEACLPWLDDPDPITRKLAAEAIVSTLGEHGAPEDLWLETEAEGDQEFDDEDLDVDPVPPVTSTLPMPNPPAVVRHWQRRRDELDPGARYVAGLRAEAVRAHLPRLPARRVDLVAGAWLADADLRWPLHASASRQLRALRAGAPTPARSEARP